MQEENTVLVLGGDGFCGWPISLYLSSNGYNVVIIDNESRRLIDKELNAQSLTPIVPLWHRLNTWRELTNNAISHYSFDVCKDYDLLLDVVRNHRPKAIVHLAEQRAAPYSMRSSFHKMYTVNNNVGATNNVLCAILDSGQDIHLIHIGTMGVYGYDSKENAIPEGYAVVEFLHKDTRSEPKEILHPMQPGSIYHTTKCLDQILFQFYNKNDGIRISDLHQGIVWGVQTNETNLHPDLINRFDYDAYYGTVLNRFLMQVAIGHPMTVYGSGQQTRAFIHIQNTVECIRLAIENPASREKVRIINQMTESHTVIDLARLIAEKTGGAIENLPNPRHEADRNDLDVKNDTLLNLGLTPILLNDQLFYEVFSIAKRYISRAKRENILNSPAWNAARKAHLFMEEAM